MPVGFSDAFGHYLPPSDDMIETAITKGLVVLDTNVLLSTYRFASDARNELISILERLADRIWIPHQVALEFHRNRLEVISEQGAAYERVISELKAHQKQISDDLDDKLRQLANRAALSSGERDHLIELVERGLEPAITAMQELRERHGVVAMLGSDSILEQLQRILNGKIGSPFTAEEQEEAEKEGARRVKEEIPPGYKDSAKKYPYGDYYLWRQILVEVSARKISNLVFVTGDSKEDWYRIIKGRVVGARSELAEEAQSDAGARLVMLDINQFLNQAKRHLGASVSSETIRQAATLPTEQRAAAEAADQSQIRSHIASLIDAQASASAELANTDVALMEYQREASFIEDLLSRYSTQTTATVTPNDRTEVAELNESLLLHRRRLDHLSAQRMKLQQRRDILTHELETAMAAAGALNRSAEAPRIRVPIPRA